MNHHELPVYQQREKILTSLENNQVIVVESPTGSGKTTQLPLILYEAGYAEKGAIGVTQPRRIAAVSVTEYISRQLNDQPPNTAAYKMRFTDNTDASTKIKIMTDGILLQELKNDKHLSRYQIIIVDEAHERSLNIDFILGLLKQLLEKRKDFKIIISSATINPEVFSEYFSTCPVVHIESKMYPVGIVYDAPAKEYGPDALLHKIVEIVSRIIEEKREGDILIFLSGEKTIKECIALLLQCPFGRIIHPLPLYGRLSKEEQERVFIPPPKGKIKIVVSTNIAETSVTIDGITSVIDSGLAKMNYYNPRTYTSSLIEGPISKASADQRKGRAGRTRPGTCYRLYSKQDFLSRPMYTTEEIYRTDLSEVVLRMSDLGIIDFEHFDFLSPPNPQGIRAAIETLLLLDAIEEDRTLSNIGKLMIEFPLIPHHSRTIVESIYTYPSVMEEVLIAVSFISTNTPYLLPQGEEITARKAHHTFRDPMGDFLSYVRLYHSYRKAKNKESFCKRYYLDERTMGEIDNIKKQLEEIVSQKGVPILSGGATSYFLCALSRGLIQFVCTRSGRSIYRSLTAEKIQIHPGSVMFRETPQYIVAAEIVKTSKTFARSVSPLKKEWLHSISPILAEDFLSPGKSRKVHSKDAKKKEERQVRIGHEVFDITLHKGKKKIVVLPWENISRVMKMYHGESLPSFSSLRGTIIFEDKEILPGEKLNTILKVVPWIHPDQDSLRPWPKGKNFQLPDDFIELCDQLNCILQICEIKKKKKILGFLALFTDGIGTYWFKCSRGFHTALSQSLASLEVLADVTDETIDRQCSQRVNETYRRLSEFFE